MSIHFQPQGVCSREIIFDLSPDGVIESMKFIGGCQGNLAGISQLVVGMKATDVIGRLQGTTCGPKPTSCPDQLSRALQKALQAANKEETHAAGV